MDEWILQSKNVETFDYNTEAWVGEAIFKGMRRYRNTKMFFCGRIGHLRRDYRQEIPRNNVFSGNGKIEGLKFLCYVENVSKPNIESMKLDQQKTDKATR